MDSSQSTEKYECLLIGDCLGRQTSVAEAWQLQVGQVTPTSWDGGIPWTKCEKADVAQNLSPSLPILL